MALALIEVNLTATIKVLVLEVWPHPHHMSSKAAVFHPQAHLPAVAVRKASSANSLERSTTKVLNIKATDKVHISKVLTSKAHINKAMANMASPSTTFNRKNDLEVDLVWLAARLLG